jgi:hypothetical protein
MGTPSIMAPFEVHDFLTTMQRIAENGYIYIYIYKSRVYSKSTNQRNAHVHYILLFALVQEAFYNAPRARNAVRNSFTAVSASSKLSAEIAHFACF